MGNSHLVLAGGGHSHVLLLRRWAMRPKVRPEGLITLINRKSTLLYSGMVPGLISREYDLQEIAIDLRALCDQARVSFVLAEITGLDPTRKYLKLLSRPPIAFDLLSLDVGAETQVRKENIDLEVQSGLMMQIKPLETALAWLNHQDLEASLPSPKSFRIIGSGMTGIEVSIALRKRWPNRHILLQTYPGKPIEIFRKALAKLQIELVRMNDDVASIPTLICTGSKAPDWLAESGLAVDKVGRILTRKTLQVLGQDSLFASGDCATIENEPRPPSGVWAVKAAKPLALNLELFAEGKPLLDWNPQHRSLQLLGVHSTRNVSLAFAIWGGVVLGPNHLFWVFKQFIDRRFINRMKLTNLMANSSRQVLKRDNCRGCAAKLPQFILKDVLQKVEHNGLLSQPEDCAVISSNVEGDTLLQSVDGFPALVSDPWLNGRISAIHACSDLWASGATVVSAQVVVRLPRIDPSLQKELLFQSLEGIQSVLKPQGAEIIGGHTLVSEGMLIEPCSLAVEIDVSVNGKLSKGKPLWTKDGLNPDDVLLLSRSLGSGVLFAAAMRGGARPEDIDKVINEMSTSQHFLMDHLFEVQVSNHGESSISAATDVTGFGFLGHLGEMITATNSRRHLSGKRPLNVKLAADSIPFFRGTMSLFEAGFCSTLAPANRNSLNLLKSNRNSKPLIEIEYKKYSNSSTLSKNLILELLVDPQTCGPLLISCSETVAASLLQHHRWHRVGKVRLT